MSHTPLLPAPPVSTAEKPAGRFGPLGQLSRPVLALIAGSLILLALVLRMLLAGGGADPAEALAPAPAPSSAPGSAPPASPEPGPDQALSPEQLEVRDPFRALIAAPAPGQPPATIVPLPGGSGYPLPGATDYPWPSTGPVGVLPTTSAAPVTLQVVSVAADSMSAVLEVDGEQVPVKPGQVLGGRVSVLSIMTPVVTFDSGTARFDLGVGQRRTIG